MRMRSVSVVLAVCGLLCAVAQPGLHAAEPVRLIFDTDMGNDIDDCLALGVIHALQSRGECQLLAVTLSKDNAAAAPFCDAVNTFYGRGEIPIGVVRNGKTPENSPYLDGTLAAKHGGALAFPRDLHSGADAPDAVALLRQILAEQPDQSVVLVVVGFSTNILRLLESPADANVPVTGQKLVTSKVRELVMMAGMFSPQRVKEYNIFIDAPAARALFEKWPTPLVTSGFEIGTAVKYPAESIVRDFNYVPHHPLPYAYKLYQKFPYDRETWDLTSVLYAVRPDRGYFGLSDAGQISVDAQDVTQFASTPNGKQRYLTLTPGQMERVKEALVQLASQPPDQLPTVKSAVPE